MTSSLARSIAISAFLSLLSIPLLGQASPYVVTTTADSATPSVGMLRFAITSRNACSTVCPAITFAIPNTDPGCVAGTCTITLDTGAGGLPAINAAISPVAINGGSQGTFNGLNILINGNGVAGDGILAISPVNLSGFYIGGFPTGAAVRLGTNADSSSIQTLNIGFNAAGTPFPNETGITIETGYSNAAISAAVRNSTLNGIRVGAAPGDTTIRGVRLYALSLRDNGGLGIDLGNNGITPNDANDADTGVNNLQNFPVITSAAETSMGGVRVQGTFNVDDPFGTYDLEVYGTFAGDPEAASSLGVFTFNSPGTNTVAFDTGSAISAWSPSFTHITTTLTKRDFSLSRHETSEISAAAVVVRADLAIAKTGPATVVAGRSISWNLNVKNLSPEVAATTVTVTDTVPAGVSGISASGAGWTCGVAGSTVTCTAASLPVSYDGNITVSGTAPVGPATITNSATIAASAGNNVATNDTSTVTTTLVYPDLTVTKSVAPSPASRGGSVTYTITVTNGGAGGADGVQVVDTLPASFTLVSTSGGGWSCSAVGNVVTCVRTAGELPASTSAVLGLVATASSTAGTYTNSVTVSSTNESNGANNSASVSVNVVNAAPVANGDSYAGTEDTVLTVAAPGVLSNDSDADGDPLSAAVVSGPTNGTVTLNANGSFTYTPNANFNGTDSFTYEASDGTNVGGPASVTLTIAAVNDAPVAANDAATTSEDTPVAIAVLSNDSDPDGTTPSVSGNSAAANGTVSCTASNCTYTPNANFNGTDSFTYTITDGSLTSTATVTVTVNAVNDAPVAANDAATTSEDTAVVIAVLSNDSDPDGTTPSVSGNSAAANGTVSCTVSNCTYTPNANFNGTDSFTYTITDGSLTSTATVTVTVTAVNDPPTAAPDSASTTADTPVVINVLANDSDTDGGTLSVTAWTNGSLGTVSCTPTGACTYTPSGTTGIDTFTYTVSDGAGGTSTGTVTVTVGQVPCPTAVSGLSPSSGSQAGPSGTLSWSGGTGATSFRVYFGPAGSGCQTLFGTTSARQIAYSGLAPGEYDWKVVAEKPGCTAPPQSSCVRFRVCPNAGPSLIAPAAGAQTNPNTQFSWSSIPGALRYHLIITSPTSGTQEIAVIAQPAPPVPETISTTVNVPLGSFTWQVVADFATGCASVPSAGRSLTVVPDCPAGSPEPIFPLEGSVVDATPVTFRWVAVPGALRYELFLSINGSALQSAGTVDGAQTAPSLAADVPAGAALSWRVDAILPEGCRTASSRVVQVSVSCFPPVLSLQGEVTTEKPYQVRATIVSVGSQYIFEESASENFTTVLASKQGEIDATGQFVFAMFEHSVTEPRAFYYRVRLAQQGCGFSTPGRIVVIPLPPPTSTDAETVVQFGNEEEVRQPLFIASPTPDRQTSYSYVATTDREWMRVEPSGGTIGPAGVTVTVVTNPVGLPVGTNTGTVTLTFVELAGSGKQALETTPVTGSKPVSVTLVTPVTNKGKGGPNAESLIIPAVAHATGVNSEWQTDVRILNLSAQKATYRLFWTSTATDATLSGKNSDLELAPGQSSALDDIVKQWYGLGSMPGEHATGVLEIRPMSSTGAGKEASAVPVTRSLTSLASSRTYNKTPQGTLGEYIPAIPFASFVGGTPPANGEKSVLSLQQLAQSSSYRTNIGVAEASGQPVSLEMRFYDGDGTKLLTVPVSLRAGEHQQFNQILAANGLTNVTSARAEIEVVSGDGKIAAYASVVDNVTGDPLQVRAVDLATLGARKYVLPGIAHFDTGLARWRSDVQVFNAGLASVTATVSFFPVGATSAAKTATVEIGPGKMRTLADIVPTLFGSSNTGGAIQIATATNSELVITGRTYDQREAGSYGQFMAAVTEDEAIGTGDRAVQVLQMEQSSKIRSNLGLVEVSGKPVRVEITAFPAESRVTPRLEFNLQPNEFRQLNEVLKTLNAGTTYNARVGVRVISGDGKIVAYGSAVDNLTQDPTFIPGQ